MSAAADQRKENVSYKATMGKPLPREEIEKLKGHYDKEGFYVLEEDGAFYDPNGYYFDAEGYDQFGGYYENGYYKPGEEFAEEYYRRYEEMYGEEDDEYDMEDYFSDYGHSDDEDDLDEDVEGGAEEKKAGEL